MFGIWGDSGIVCVCVYCVWLFVDVCVDWCRFRYWYRWVGLLVCGCGLVCVCCVVDCFWYCDRKIFCCCGVGWCLVCCCWYVLDLYCWWCFWGWWLGCFWVWWLFGLWGYWDKCCDFVMGLLGRSWRFVW